ncbi:PREDICTED: uncharacterized protein LOC109225444 isoform X2 [Nicotiana attenuata]|uniref:uncharacterized protein LOC109225444 isoform X2 n=1 Tax=Nicotiana attenuata TaxID=49451 RepID=UPI0009053803|nr:PREDICTED: uncharacterized protein LOC109225444 isoform X2 [Nicotiana attenuata]
MTFICIQVGSRSIFLIPKIRRRTSLSNNLLFLSSTGLVISSMLLTERLPVQPVSSSQLWVTIISGTLNYSYKHRQPKKF